jgi:chromosomal replication initiator protein
MTDVIFIDPSEEETYGSAAGSAAVRGAEYPAAGETAVMQINPKYNFENFVVGGCNKLVYSAARAVAEEPGIRYNPLFIYGGAGLGKTHIMHAIGNSVRVSFPTLKVLYVSSEKFVNEFIESIRTTKGKSTDFREKYRRVDVLMIDDIQFFSGKSGTQEEMFHTFNELYTAKKQLVFTSDRSPKELPELEERLRSRFGWGLIADVQPPDLETRIAILQKKAEEEKYNIPAPVLQFMAESISSNVREMESLLNKVILLSRLDETAPGIEKVSEALKDYASRSDDTVSEEAIIDSACRYYKVSREDLIGKKKNREIAEPRQVCIYIINEMLSLPLASIGNLFGGRDHTTIMHARDKIATAIQSNIKIKVAVQDIKDMAARR